MKKAILKLTMNSLAVATLFSGCIFQSEYKPYDWSKQDKFIASQNLIKISNNPALQDAPIWVLNPKMQPPMEKWHTGSAEKIEGELIKEQINRAIKNASDISNRQLTLDDLVYVWRSKYDKKIYVLCATDYDKNWENK